ncbi:uncharacterized protein LOC142575563 isoform X3 [Dermacentor variabilis]|uniref:uncharacterized protein LOC142575563 isoform X3 n=1 Tax=Dermacentor variabilis TaxID=34621 RepID=UPI003F5BE7D9
MMNISTKSMTRRPPKGFSKMTHPGDIFAVDCLRSIVPTQQIVAQMNEDYKKAVQAERINDANLTLIINDLGQAEPSFANEPEAGHAARSVNSADYAARLEFQDLRKAAPDVHPS